MAARDEPAREVTPTGVPARSRRLALAAALVQLAALACAVAAVRRDGARGWLALAAVALVLLGGAVRRRSVVGVVVAAAVLVAVVSRATEARWCEAVAAVAFVAVLVASREATWWPAPARRLLAGRLAIVALVMLAVVGTFGARSAVGDGHGSVGTALRSALERMVARPSEWLDQGGLAGVLQRALPGLTALVVLGALAVLLSWSPDDDEPDEETRRRVDALCASADGDTLAPFTRRRDKRLVFSDDGRAVLGYRVVMGVCVAGPGPVGAVDARRDAMAAFVRRCDERGWRPTMIGASDEARALATEVGMRGIRIGDEAVVDLHSYELDQPSMRNVRQAVKRSRNFGVTVTVHREGELSESLRADLIDVVEAWRRGRGELGFAMTLDGLLDGSHPDAELFVAHHDGRAVGFQRYLRCRNGRALSLDVMPRRREAPNGVNERLIDEAVAWGRAHDVEELSLNFAAFRTWFEAEASVGIRVLRGIVRLLDPFINVESLYRFNAKFRPGWVPRHVLHRHWADVPWLLAAALRVEFGRRRAAGTTHTGVPASADAAAAR